MTLKRILMFAAIAEIATGVALVFAPMLVVKLLLGVYAPWTSLSIGRVTGVAVLSLGIACWPGGGLDRPRPAAWRGMLVVQRSRRGVSRISLRARRDRRRDALAGGGAARARGGGARVDRARIGRGWHQLGLTMLLRSEAGGELHER